MSDPISHLESVLARYSTAQGGSPSELPTELGIAGPAAPRGSKDHLRDLTYASLGVVGELRRARARISELEQGAEIRGATIAALRQGIEGQGQAIVVLEQRADADKQTLHTHEQDLVVIDEGQERQGRMIAALWLAWGAVLAVSLLALMLSLLLWFWR